MKQVFLSERQQRLEIQATYLRKLVLTRVNRARNTGEFVHEGDIDNLVKMAMSVMSGSELVA